MEKDDTYNEIEKEFLEELHWITAQLRRDRLLEKIDEPTYQKMKEMFEKDRAMVIDRSNGRRDEEEQWKRTDLTEAERKALKKKMNAGKEMDAKLIQILNLMREKKAEFLSNWNKDMGLS